MSAQNFPRPLNQQLDKLSDPIPTNDVLADALLVTETTYFKGSGSSYTGTVPSNNFKYGVFCVVKRNDASFIVHATSADGTSSNYYDGSAWGGWTPSTSALNSKFAISRLTITRTENIYCTDTQLQRCRVYKRSGWYSIVINLQTSAKSATSDFTEIGRISNYNAYFDVYLTIPAQETLDKEIVLTITTGGIIKLYASHGTAGDFYRSTTSIPIDD